MHSMLLAVQRQVTYTVLFNLAPVFSGVVSASEFEDAGARIPLSFPDRIPLPFPKWRRIIEVYASDDEVEDEDSDAFHDARLINAHDMASDPQPLPA